ncbi:LysE family transporter [Pelosinus sp. Bkl1]|uniref:LysE family transporter n=1 Tax=Pelosinus baikalensis TaxID=2892015 RepID=A0ABS8HYT7_9FIRM|nr:LysE family transporter [Pelosinus baikalensis]
MLLALVGVGAIISASLLAFNIVKVIGIIYLIYIGVKMWVDSSEISISSKIDKPSSKMSELKSGFLISFLNPKVIIFFSSFIPQYIDKEKPFFIKPFFWVEYIYY